MSFRLVIVSKAVIPPFLKDFVDELHEVPIVPWDFHDDLLQLAEDREGQVEDENDSGLEPKDERSVTKCALCVHTQVMCMLRVFSLMSRVVGRGAP